MTQFCQERLIKDPVTGRVSWAVKSAGPQHKADAMKLVITGVDFLIDGPRSRAGGALPPVAPPRSRHPHRRYLK